MSRDMAAGQRFIGLRDSANADDYAAAVTKLVRDLDINTVPTFIVNSRYRVVVTDAVPETISELELVVNSLRRQR
jgi:protein-disulfide isomerase